MDRHKDDDIVLLLLIINNSSTITSSVAFSTTTTIIIVIVIVIVAPPSSLTIIILAISSQPSLGDLIPLTLYQHRPGTFHSSFLYKCSFYVLIRDGNCFYFYHYIYGHFSIIIIETFISVILIDRIIGHLHFTESEYALKCCLKSLM